FVPGVRSVYPAEDGRCLGDVYRDAAGGADSASDRAARYGCPLLRVRAAGGGCGDDSCLVRRAGVRGGGGAGGRAIRGIRRRYGAPNRGHIVRGFAAVIGTRAYVHGDGPGGGGDGLRSIA